MCYSAQIWSDFHKYERFGGALNVKEFVKLFWERRKSGDWTRKIPKAVRDAFSRPRNEAEMAPAKLVAESNREAVAAIELELAAQTTRLLTAEAILASAKPTKKAANDQRIATDKIAKAMRDRDDLARKDLQARDSRMYPGQFVPVMIDLDGQRTIVPMRYQCRLPGWTEAVERKYPGTYNARRDNLEKAWGKLFSYQHGVMVVERFYENVEQHGKNVVLEFVPQNNEPMMVACLWNRSTGPDGEDFFSFAAVTDDPPPEIAIAGHDRCIIPIKPENIDAWLNPEPGNVAAAYFILDDRERPYYVYQVAA
jgi:putative SOS response-associated peptidase YedK